MFGNLIDGSQSAFTVRRVVLVGQIPRNCSESCGCMTINGREISGAACSIMGICLLFVIFLSLTFSITLSLPYPQFPAALYRGSASYCGDLCREVRRIFLYFEKKKTIPCSGRHGILSLWRGAFWIFLLCSPSSCKQKFSQKFL